MNKVDRRSRKRLTAMHSADLEAERQWLEGELERLGREALKGEPVGTVVAEYQADMDADMAEIQRRLRASTLPTGGVRPSFDTAFIDRVKAATDLVALVEASGTPLKKAGKTWKGLCPFHDEKTPSLTIYQDGGWHCFGCHKSGDAIAWIMQSDGLTFPQAMRRLAEDAGIALPEQTRAASADPDGRATLPAAPVAPGNQHCTDMGNSRRFALLHRDRVRYCHTWKDWLVWDGTRWARDADAQVQRLARETVISIYAEASQALDKAHRKALGKWAWGSEAERRIRAMLSLAQAEPELAITATTLDTDAWVLNVVNGTLDLRSGQLRPHDPADLITKLCPVVYDPGATLPLWDRFLKDATDDDPELIRFLARAVGYTLAGTTQEEKLFFIHGPTNSGKSTFMDAVKAMLGDYGLTADFETFLHRSHTGGPRPDIARLAGARIVCSVEVAEGKKLAEGLVKLLTGGDTVTARFLFRSDFEYLPQFTLWLAANAEPRIRHDDMALWRRVLKVPFDKTVPEDKRDPYVKATLRDPNIAGSALLAWAVQGCLDWQAVGLQIPNRVRKQTEAFRLEQDPLKEWAESCCYFGPAAWTSARDLRASYKTWGEENGISERFLVRGKKWGAGLRARGCRQKPRREHETTRKGWYGIGLQSENHQGQENVTDVTDSERFTQGSLVNLSRKEPCENDPKSVIPVTEVELGDGTDDIEKLPF